MKNGKQDKQASADENRDGAWREILLIGNKDAREHDELCYEQSDNRVTAEGVCQKPTDGGGNNQQC